jgi:phospholipid transport system substrate-binding protein
MMRRTALGVVKYMVAAVFGLALGGAAAYAATAPDQLVRDRTGRIIELLKVNKDAYTKDPKKLSAMVDKEVLPYFDFRAMSRLVLGKYWREASEDQRNRFTQEFRDLLVRTYATALLKYTNEQVFYLPYRDSGDGKTTVVRTEIKQGGGGPTIPIHYSFYLTDGEWKVYDVVIDGVSLVTTYRGAYSEKIRSQGMDALITSMARSDKDDQINRALEKKPGGAR